ncbi:Flagellar protein FliO [Gammaproteobacteria bacterium]|nr:flagellar biosynthetic protein FliO [Zoogloeaceae bacterium]MCK6385564.1 flagellar biosynthetic protein FliO [Rhodocyclaceae bacterium]CAG0945124.1 Flagellar protein FliO [Gammaproteobacteria bacterium]
MRKLFIPLLAALPAVALAQSAPTALPQGSAGLFQVFLGLAVVIAALVASLWLIKRLSIPRGGAAGALRVVAGAAVGPRERVVLVEVQDTWLVVGVAPGQVSALHQMPKGALAAEPAAPAGKDFGGWLKQVMERRHDAR